MRLKITFTLLIERSWMISVVNVVLRLLWLWGSATRSMTGSTTRQPAWTSSSNAQSCRRTDWCERSCGTWAEQHLTAPCCPTTCTEHRYASAGIPASVSNHRVAYWNINRMFIQSLIITRQRTLSLMSCLFIWSWSTVRICHKPSRTNPQMFTYYRRCWGQSINYFRCVVHKKRAFQ